MPRTLGWTCEQPGHLGTIRNHAGGAREAAHARVAARGRRGGTARLLAHPLRKSAHVVPGPVGELLRRWRGFDDAYECTFS